MTPSLDINQSNLNACSSRRPRAIGSSARAGRGLCSARVPQLVVALYAPPDVPARSAVQRAGPGLCPGAVPQPVVALYAPPDASAQSAVQRAWAGVFVQREFRSRQRPLTPPQTPRAVAELARGALGFVPAQFRSWQRPLAAASEDRLSTGQSPGPFLAATPTVPSQRCGPSCSPSPRGNGGHTRGHGSRSARAQQSPGQSRPDRRSCWGCW